MRGVRRGAAATASVSAAALVAAGLAGVGLTAGPASAGEDRACRVVRLAEPSWGYDGGVMDIEVVDGRTTYYGSTYRRDKHGVEHQRAIVWDGLDGAPVQVGPPGYDADIAFELTATGLVNGQSEDWSTGREVAWVQDLATGAITILDTDSGPSGADHGRMWIRRINDRGSVVGALGRGPDQIWTDAVLFDTPASTVQLLPGAAEAGDSNAYGINNLDQKAGYLSTRPVPEFPDFYWFDPVRWEADGSITPLSVDGGLEAAPRAVKDDGSVSGSISFGTDLFSAHIEPAYWPTPDTVVALGSLPGGGWGDVFGMDEGGWLVGAIGRGVKRNHRLGNDGWMDHAFMWMPETTPDTVRILPSLYAVSKEQDDWRSWQGTAVHAVNRDLRQAASGSHVEFRYGRPITAPTVWLEADRCGREVATTHDPYGVGAGEVSAQRRAVNVPHRVQRAWKQSHRR
jgi:hypothetical protein